MPLILLGLVFVIAMFAYYLISTMGNSSPKKKEKDNSLKEEENVIFLPNDLEKEKEKHRR